MITDHVYRDAVDNGRRNPWCGFMNCRRLPAEHQRSVSGRYRQKASTR